MNVIIPIAEIGNYIVFSILIGHVALQFVSETNKPKINISRNILLLSTLGIFVFTLGPVAQTISYFSDSVGLTLAIFSVLTDFQVGQAWIFIGFMSVFLWMTILVNGSKGLCKVLGITIWTDAVIKAYKYYSRFGFCDHKWHTL
jgi:copper resistance protein D